jgi:L-alanine-DL-glutamate epimerase-like enolase superfamily enzyme
VGHHAPRVGPRPSGQHDDRYQRNHNALWDLKGRYLNVPVYSIIGGPTRQEVPAYSSMLGYDVLDMGKVKERAKQHQELGYTAQKWFFRHGPMSGAEGLKKNVELVETLRETLGDDDDIMLDCWQSMNVNYVIRLAEQIEEFHPRWLEECAMPDRIDSYRKIQDQRGHEHTAVWGRASLHKMGHEGIHQCGSARYSSARYLLGGWAF